MSDSDDWAVVASSDDSDFAADYRKNANSSSPHMIPMAGTLLYLPDQNLVYDTATQLIYANIGSPGNPSPSAMPMIDEPPTSTPSLSGDARVNGILSPDGVPSVEAFARLFVSFKNVLVLSGAGLSTAAGIPDYRSSGTGLYTTLSKYNLPQPECLFDIEYFKDDPEPLCDFLRTHGIGILQGAFQPTIAHRFIKALFDRGVLLRHYTQNVDGLDIIAGLPKDKSVAVHGSYSSAQCVQCRTIVPIDKFVADLVGKQATPPLCPKPKCRAFLKPSIVMYGEPLPQLFFEISPQDVARADCVIIMGTSLAVKPFSDLPERVGPLVPRLLMNMTGVAKEAGLRIGQDGASLPGNYRDVPMLGNFEDTIPYFCSLVGLKL